MEHNNSRHFCLPNTWIWWGGTVYTGSHTWSNTPIESFYCFYTSSINPYDRECIVGYNYGYGGETVYATTTQIGCY
ncbi:MAG: hypothetical protein PHE29_06550 [Tissierellia bacterium]|nr:hypothetical protein [Tissierellia bacterium]